MSFWNQRSFCVITGASRGIGKGIAIEFAKKVKTGSVFLLLARSENALEQTKSEMLQSGIDDIRVVTVARDLGKPDAADYLNIFTSTIASVGASAADFDHAILVHNAASLGNIGLRAIEVENLQEIRDFYEFNFYSMILLTSQFFKVFNDSGKQRSIIQITSGGAIEPFKTWSLYCAGKAARDKFIRSITLEDPSISGINYAPGLVDTNIYTEAETKTGDTSLAQQFQAYKSAGEVRTPSQTAIKLIQILEEKNFVKGEHVSYDDVPDLAK